jgi:hypothetical protein
MEEVLDLYALPYNPKEPLICFDEKSKELHADTRTTQHTQEGCVRRRDYEYRRNGTANIFMTVEPQGGYRTVQVTAHRTREDFAHEIKRITELPRYLKATMIHIVLDNLNTHNEKSLVETFGEAQTHTFMRRIIFHHTPKHASWLNMAEIELSVMEGQCTKGRVPDATALKKKLKAWQRERNKASTRINWKFTTDEARKIFRYKTKLC